MTIHEQIEYGLHQASEERLRRFLEGTPLAIQLFPDELCNETYNLLRNELRSRSIWLDETRLFVNANELKGLYEVWLPTGNTRQS